jgi:hypothetical protein
VSGDFDRVFAGYFLSHVPRDRAAPFIRSVVDRAGSGGRVLLVDNLYVDGSSLPVSRTDSDGNTYQDRLVRPYASRVGVSLLTYCWLLRMDLQPHLPTAPEPSLMPL